MVNQSDVKTIHIYERAKKLASELGADLSLGVSMFFVTQNGYSLSTHSIYEVIGYLQGLDHSEDKKDG